MTKRTFRHIKTHNVYTFLGTVVNATNSAKDSTMVLYERNGVQYVREEEEFHSRFKEITSSE